MLMLLSLILVVSPHAFATGKDCGPSLRADQKRMEGIVHGILFLDEQRATSAGLFGRLDDVVVAGIESKDTKFAAALLEELEPDLESDSTDLGKALGILSRPRVRELLQQNLNVSFPEDITLADVLDEHPTLKRLRAAKDPSTPQNLRALKLLREFAPNEFAEPDEPIEQTSYRKALRQALSIYHSTTNLQSSSEQIQKPLKDWRPLASIP